MKYLTLLMLFWAGPQLHAQPPSSANQTYGMVINGKIFESGAAVPKEDLKHLSGLFIINLKTKKHYKPTQFEWIVSQNGQVTKSESTNHDNWGRLPGLLANMDDKAILFLDEIKTEPPAILPQFYLKAQ